MKKLLVFLIFVLLLLTIAYAQENSKSKAKIITADLDPSNNVLLKSRHFTPDRGISEEVKAKISAKFPQKQHVLLQLDAIPTAEEKKQLEEQGIDLLSYVPNKAWLASVKSKEPEKLLKIPSVRAIADFLPADKTSSAVKNMRYATSQGKLNLTIAFFGDADLGEAALDMQQYGEVVETAPFVNSLKLRADENLISDIAAQENVQWIDVADKILQIHNDGNRANIGVNTLQASPYGLSGTNIVAAEWDGGWADTAHDDLQGRITIGDAGCAETYCSTATHATHVAGTMLGNGALSAANGGTALQWRGMAANATLISYEWWDTSSELNSEYDSAINTYAAGLSQNSWGYTYTSCGSDCSGGYDSFAAELDRIIRHGKGKRISQVWSAGNNRPANCDKGSYDCIGIPGTAKNAITVGATNSDDNSITYFTSFGPTNDGRLKPEVTAPGCEGDKNDGTVTGSVYSTFPGDIYGGFCGTSMAAPTTSGVVALMLEEFAGKGVYPFPSTIKAVLIHTANDLGNAGPDYSFGYGRINATQAIDLIKNDTESNNVIVEDEIPDQGKAHLYEMEVPSGQAQLKVTLAWDDYQGTPNAAKELVNDLDLTLTAPNGTAYLPFVLDPATPGNVATTGIDDVNNVEQVIANPLAGTWQIRVNGTSVPQAPQNYSLVSTDNLTRIRFGQLVPYLISPVTNLSVAQNEFFNFSSGVKCVGGKCGNVVATLDPAAIYCNSSPCVASSALIKSRDRIGPGPQNNEPNQPNTIDNCSDGSVGNYLSDESIENVTVTDLDHGVFKIGDAVKVEITAHCWTGGSSNDNINFAYTTDSVTPSWRVVGAVSGCPVGGFNALSKTFKLDMTEGNHTIRGIIQYQGSTSTTCGTGSYDDNDDVTIFVSAEGIKGKIPMNNGAPFYTISNNPQTCANMQDGDTCNQTWQVNATGAVNTAWEFFSIYEPATYDSFISGGETGTLNITIAEFVPSAKFISITLIGFPINFGSIDRNTNYAPASGNLNGSYIIRVEPETNVTIDLFQKGEDFASSEDLIRVGNVSSAIVNSTVNATPLQIAYNGANPVTTNIAAGTNTTVYYWINIPNPRAGDYNSTISIKAVESGEAP